MPRSRSNTGPMERPACSEAEHLLRTQAVESIGAASYNLREALNEVRSAIVRDTDGTRRKGLAAASRSITRALAQLEHLTK